MPVSFTVASHPAEAVKFSSWRKNGHTTQEMLVSACPQQSRKAERIVQFAFSDQGYENDKLDANMPNPFLNVKMLNVLPQQNGFISTVVTAWNDHHALVIRPDDVWPTVLSQFNFFINANAERLRSAFVDHEGQLELNVVDDQDDIYDFGDMARQMVDAMHKNLADPTLRDWALPKFTTTTQHDTTIGAILLMATLKEYFDYDMLYGICGLPRVTLEGEKSDWLQILTRLEKLKEYGIQTIAWYHLLHPVITRFIHAFDAPGSQENIEFWQRIVYHDPGSGCVDLPYYSGWINAFAVFDKEGVWKGHKLRDAESALRYKFSAAALSTERFWAKYATGTVHKDLILDGTPYHRITLEDFPPAFAEVDVKVQFKAGAGTVDCVMVAGVVGTRVVSSGDAALSAKGRDDVLKPLSGWWLFTKKELVMNEEEK